MLYVYKNRVLNRLIGLGISNSAQLLLTPEWMNLEPIFDFRRHNCTRTTSWLEKYFFGQKWLSPCPKLFKHPKKVVLGGQRKSSPSSYMRHVTCPDRRRYNCGEIAWARVVFCDKNVERSLFDRNSPWLFDRIWWSMFGELKVDANHRARLIQIIQSSYSNHKSSIGC